MTLIADTSRRADTESPLMNILAERWSPRAYDRNAAIAAAFNLTPEQDVVTVTALGVLGDASSLTTELREREVAPCTRLPLAELLLAND